MVTASSDRILRRIAIIVLCSHAALLLWAAFTVKDIQVLPPIKERLVVKTIALNQPTPQKVTIIPIAEPEAPPPQPEPTPEPEPEPPTSLPPVIEDPPLAEAPSTIPVESMEEVSPSPPEPEKTAEPPPPKPVIPAKKAESKPKTKPKKEPPPKKKAKPIDKKKVKPAKAPPKDGPKTEKKIESPPKPDPKEAAAKVAKAAAQAKRRALLTQAQKKIAQIEQGHATLGDNTSVMPAKIGALQVETMGRGEGETLTPQEITYYEELASRLKLKLRLPEYGEVKIKLTLTRGGRFVKVVVVSAESSKNRQYIEKMLSTLSYPAFGKNFTGSEHYTFTIALSNEF